MKEPFMKRVEMDQCVCGHEKIWHGGFWFYIGLGKGSCEFCQCPNFKFDSDAYNEELKKATDDYERAKGIR